MSYDAVVVGSGPNGLAAAITLAREGWSVLVLEAAREIGGGTRSAELTLPGFTHDICSAIHPLAVSSPLFKQLPLEEHGLQWIHPDAPLAHPLDDGTAVVVERSLEATAASLGADGDAYRRLLEPLVAEAEALIPQILSPLSLPRHPLLMARFGLLGLRSVQSLAQGRFQQELVPGLLAGMAAHSVLPLDRCLTAAVALMFCITAHSTGWPMPRGGSRQIALAMEKYLRSLGGEIVTEHPVGDLKDLPPARVVLLDVTPRQFLQMAHSNLPPRYRRQLERFRYGPGVFKMDWALDGPIPWKAAGCARAGTVHLGGTMAEISAAEDAVWSGNVTAPHQPFLLVAQQSLFDPTRAPEGKHTGWAYCHVPHGSTVDMTEQIEAQMERFAPGFRDLVLARHVMGTSDFQSYNANYIGGDTTGGVMDLWQIAARPVLRWNPYATPAKGVFICSSSTPPGPGVHGMCGYHAARAALRSMR